MNVIVFMGLLVLATGLGTISAQTNVGGVPIVGYAAVAIPGGISLLANPLNAGLTNGANEIGLLIDGETIATWNGLGFDSYTYSLNSGGWIDANSQPTTPPSLPPGKGLFFFNPGPATNITFTGLIVPNPGNTNRLILASGYSLVSSALAATVPNITSAPVSLPLIDGMQILAWNGNGYTFSLYDSGLGGWVDANLKPKTAPSYSIGQGFFMFNPGPAVTWEQSLP